MTTTLPTKSTEYARLARAKGLHLRGISQSGVHLLARVHAEPVALQKRQPGQRNQHTPSGQGSVSLGPLIVHGLVVLSNGFYVTTAKGGDYLAKMRRAGML